MSMPASSCSFTASTVASRFARASSSPFDFQGAQSVLGSASHSGFGKEPAIVVGNNIVGVSLKVTDRTAYLPCLVGQVHTKKCLEVPLSPHPRYLGSDPLYNVNGKENHDRPLLRADAERLENLDHAGGTWASL